MLVTKINPFTGKETTVEIAVTQSQLDDWNHGVLIQRAMPNLTPAEREFIRICLTDEEFKELHLPYNEHE